MFVGVLDAAPAHAAPVGSNQQTVWDYFVSQGLSPVATAGLVGNLDYESNGVNPNASQCGSHEVNPPRSYCGVGIAQWTWGTGSKSNRWQDLVGLANIEGEHGIHFGTTNPGDFPSLSVQEQYVWQELHTINRAALDQMNGCASKQPVSAAIQCATYAVQSKYEVPQNSTNEDADPGCATPPGFCGRYADAIAVYKTYAMPEEPLGVRVEGTNSSAVALTWSPSGGASQYDVLRNGAYVGLVNGTAFIDHGLAPGAGYQYTVVAKNANGYSSPSPVVPATTLPATPTLSVSQANVGSGGGDVTLGASAGGASLYEYSYTPSPGAAPIHGWLPGVPILGHADSLHLGMPANTSAHAVTYTVSVEARDGAGGSEPRTATITVAGRKGGAAASTPAKAAATPAKAAAASTPARVSTSWRLGLAPVLPSGGARSSSPAAHAR